MYTKSFKTIYKFMAVITAILLLCNDISFAAGRRTMSRSTDNLSPISNFEYGVKPEDDTHKQFSRVIETLENSVIFSEFKEDAGLLYSFYLICWLLDRYGSQISEENIRKFISRHTESIPEKQDNQKSISVKKKVVNFLITDKNDEQLSFRFFLLEDYPENKMNSHSLGIGQVRVIVKDFRANESVENSQTTTEQPIENTQNGVVEQIDSMDDHQTAEVGEPPISQKNDIKILKHNKSSLKKIMLAGIFVGLIIFVLEPLLVVAINSLPNAGLREILPILNALPENIMFVSTKVVIGFVVFRFIGELLAQTVVNWKNKGIRILSFKNDFNWKKVSWAAFFAGGISQLAFTNFICYLERIYKSHSYCICRYNIFNSVNITCFLCWLSVN